MCSGHDHDEHLHEDFEDEAFAPELNEDLDDFDEDGNYVDPLDDFDEDEADDFDREDVLLFLMLAAIDAEDEGFASPNFDPAEYDRAFSHC
jgi:hypothetical protein